MRDSREGAKTRRNVEELTVVVVNCAYRLHVETGPGLLESVYEVVLTKMLENEGLSVQRQAPVPVDLMGMRFDEGFCADLIVEGELKKASNESPTIIKTSRLRAFA